MTPLQMSDGRQLNYLDIGAGPTVFLLHGWAMSSGIFSVIIDDLAKDFRLLIPDLRGHGTSAVGTTYTLNDFAADIIALFKYLKLDNCHLLGWSLGGQIAMQLVADKLLPVERLIVVSSTPKFCQATDWLHGLPEVQVRALQRQLRRNSTSTIAEFMQMMFSGEQDTSMHIVSTSKQRILPDNEAGMQSLETLKTADIRSRLSAINTPTMVQHGKLDIIIPAAAGEYIANNIHAAELIVWDDVGHVPFMSRPQESVSVWKEFLQ